MGMKEPDGTPASDSSVLVELGNIIAAGADVSLHGDKPTNRPARLKA